MVDDSAHFFEVRLDSFDGPIDLLLHLVKKNELPIEKLSLYQISTQYFECLAKMRNLDLEIAGEYLVIAATLLSIKSSILLNEPVEFVEDEDGQMVDPHQQLLERIREAAIYKDGAMALASRDILGLDVFESRALFERIEPLPAQLKDHDPILLAKAFARVLEKRKGQAPVFTISYDSVSIVQRMMTVLEHLQNSTEKKVSFEQLVTADGSDRGTVVATFLALLELAKRGAISVSQSDIFDEIYIGLADGMNQASQDALASEFDMPQKDNSEDKDQRVVNE